MINFEVKEVVKIRLNGEILAFNDQQPIVIDDRILVPARGVFEKMGMDVSWDEQNQQVTIKKGKLEISIVIDEKVLTVGNKKIMMDVPAKLLNGRTMIPLRAVSEATMAKVEWNEAENTAIIVQ